MSQAVSAANEQGLPPSLRPASLWKRAVVGVLALVFGVMFSAWLLHASIKSDPESFAAPGQTKPAQTATIR